MASAEPTLNWSTPRLLFTGGIYAFWFLVAISLTLLATDWVVKPTTYPVQSVHFAGPFTHVSQAELERIALPGLMGSFLTVDLDAAQQRIEALPWVDRAWLNRRWPNAIYVRFTEQKFVARWNNDAWLGNDGSAVVLPNHDGPQDVVQLRGPTGAEGQTLATYQKLSEQLVTIGLSIDELQLTDRDRLEERFQRFVKIYPVLVNEGRRIGRIDLRYANGVAVAWAKGRPTFSRQPVAR
jgi:cell division protein FtsQ